MTKTIIYLMRHGDVHNPKKILYGRLPYFHLSKIGIEKIKEKAEILQKKRIQYIYTSPMLRARQTAKIIAKKLGLKVKISNLLNEVKFSFEGMLLDDFVKTVQPKLYSLEYAKGGSETITQIERRMLDFIKLMKIRHKGKKILAISHGDPIVILKAAIEKKIFNWEYKKNNYLHTGDWYKFEV
uniref:Histidine phosphatase family protein n=1 Tax=candidate division CPR3 bacterium TaxID=2268181 RepID=A0A7C4M204_UNCC3